jgi:UMP-CMP kinase
MWVGGPGTGKGTMCEKLVKDWDFVHLSAGDLLRAEQARPESQYGALIKKFIQEGEIVPMEITVGLLQNAMQEYVRRDIRKFLVDGFPRKMDQALAFEANVPFPLGGGKLMCRFVRVRLCCIWRDRRRLW